MHAGCGECVCGDCACVRRRMVIAPRGAVEGWWWDVRWVVKNVNRALLMLPTQFCDEGEISSFVEGPLNLLDEVRYQ